jgi:hypothetical protein
VRVERSPQRAQQFVARNRLAPRVAVREGVFQPRMKSSISIMIART